MCFICFQVSESKTDNLNKDAIPEAKDVVKIDLVGGYAMQKVTSERSYFRWVLSTKKIRSNLECGDRRGKPNMSTSIE